MSPLNVLYVFPCWPFLTIIRIIIFARRAIPFEWFLILIFQVKTRRSMHQYVGFLYMYGFSMTCVTFNRLLSSKIYKPFYIECSLTLLIKASKTNSSINSFNFNISLLNLFKYALVDSFLNE